MATLRRDRGDTAKAYASMVRGYAIEQRVGSESYWSGTYTRRAKCKYGHPLQASEIRINVHGLPTQLCGECNRIRHRARREAIRG